MKGYLSIAEAVEKYNVSGPTVRKRLRDYDPAKVGQVKDERGVPHTVSYYLASDVKAAMSAPKGKPGRKPMSKEG